MAASTIITTWTAMQRLALRQDVGEDAGEQAQDHDRQELGGGHDAEPQRVAAGELRTSHAWATCCIQVPTSEIAWPAKKSR